MFRFCHEVQHAVAKLVFNGSIEKSEVCHPTRRLRRSNKPSYSSFNWAIVKGQEWQVIQMPSSWSIRQIVSDWLPSMTFVQTSLCIFSLACILFSNFCYYLKKDF